MGILLITAYTDLKEQKVYLHILSAGGIAGLFCCFFCQNPRLTDLLGGVIVGLIILGVAWLGKGCIGSGDGLMFMVSGIFLGFWDNLQLFLISLLLAGAAALFLIIVKKRERDLKMPLLPFTLAAYLLMLQS